MTVLFLLVVPPAPHNASPSGVSDHECFPRHELNLFADDRGMEQFNLS